MPPLFLLGRVMRSVTKAIRFVLPDPGYVLRDIKRILFRFATLKCQVSPKAHPTSCLEQRRVVVKFLTATDGPRLASTVKNGITVN